MKRMMLVVGLLVVVLMIGSLAASADQARIGSRIFNGPLLSVGVRLSGEMFQGKVYLPTDGFLCVFYEGGPEADQYLIFPNETDILGFRVAGMNNIDLSMLNPISREQKLTVIFSQNKLLSTDFSVKTERFLSVREIDQWGFWLTPSWQPLWVAELIIPSTTVGASPCWWTTVRYSVCQPRPVSSCCYRARPCVSRPSCYPASPCLLCWLLAGVILIH